MTKKEIINEIAQIIGVLKWISQIEVESDDYNRRIMEEEKNKLLDRLSKLYKIL